MQKNRVCRNPIFLQEPLDWPAYAFFLDEEKCLEIIFVKQYSHLYDCRKRYEALRPMCSMLHICAFQGGIASVRSGVNFTFTFDFPELFKLTLLYFTF